MDETLLTTCSSLLYLILQLQECMGSAVIAMGPEKLLAVLPISVDANDHTYSNVWLIPILKDYVSGSSLGFFIETLVPLAESFHGSCQKGTSLKCASVLESCFMMFSIFYAKKKNLSRYVNKP